MWIKVSVVRTADMSDATSSLCLRLILLLAVFTPTSFGGQEIITTETEQDVTLPCQAPDNIIGIEWSRPDLNEEYVLLYRDGRSDPKHQHPSFVNRVYLKDGDASLILKNVTTADTGKYECRVRTGTSRRKRAYLEIDPVSIIYLRVVDPPGEPIQEKDELKETGQEKTRLIVGLSIFAVLLVFVVIVGFLIYGNHKKKEKMDSHRHPAEHQLTGQQLNCKSLLSEREEQPCGVSVLTAVCK
ncbi:nectin-4 [Haplochromis burtoni]|uniref:nectin-4 n=1 Tax=Haplochromis burtoni TaxID=8153 RepID=UPI001C2DE6A1|nr:nectin-4 [Haplochromis burtoni]